ncbi:Ig-like domain-containing protein [Chloroflexota bacterium]
MKNIIKAFIMILVVMLIVTPLLACGGSEAPTPAPAPSPSPEPAPSPPPSPSPGNQPPVVISLTAKPPKVNPEETSTITCLATDPDGDSLSYGWSATGGTISGSGVSITWRAPATDGKFVVTVTVSDDKGGTVGQKLNIITGNPPRTITLEPIPDESGSVYSSGDLVTSFLLGDSADNNGVRAYFSFDISGLTQAEIKKAELIFHTKETVGNPWLIHSFLYIEQVDYGARSLRGGDFDLEVLELAKSTSSVPGTIDVSAPIARLLRPPAKKRFQVRLRLGQPTNHNSQDEYLSFSGAAIDIVFTR